MIPGGMNPKQMAKMMKRMGIKMDEIDAEEVIIRCVDKNIIIDKPQVVKTIVSGQEMYQVTGKASVDEVEASVDIGEDDVLMVAEQAGVSEEKARKALEDAGGDLAEAIMNLKK
ncbi:MAG: nascent polypeptide-associated complex protein [Candidatus Altiarchaeota archaeon]